MHGSLKCYLYSQGLAGVSIALSCNELGVAAVGVVMTLEDVRVPDSIETEEERKARIDEAASDARKHRGAVAGQEGYDFQDFVTPLRIIDLARMSLGEAGRCTSVQGWKIDPISTRIKQNAPDTRVDDLMIENSTHLLYSQIKKGNVGWKRAIVADFEREIARARPNEMRLHLEYCVSDRFRSVRLMLNRPDHLRSVQPWFEDITLMDCPHADANFCRSLDVLITSGARSATFENVWHQLVASWTEACRREATLQEVFLHASEQLKYAIRSLRKQEVEMKALLVVLRNALPELYLTADGFILLVRERGIVGKAFVHVDVTDHVEELRNSPPTTAFELYDRLGLVDNDDEYED